MIVQPEILVGLPSQLLERRPDILQAEATLVAATAPIGQARVYFFPSLSITGQGGLQSVEFANWFAGNGFEFRGGLNSGRGNIKSPCQEQGHRKSKQENYDDKAQ